MPGVHGCFLINSVRLLLKYRYDNEKSPWIIITSLQKSLVKGKNKNKLRIWYLLSVKEK